MLLGCGQGMGLVGVEKAVEIFLLNACVVVGCERTGKARVRGFRGCRHRKNVPRLGNPEMIHACRDRAMKCGMRQYIQYWALWHSCLSSLQENAQNTNL